jgi:hypothetical protein
MNVGTLILMLLNTWTATTSSSFVSAFVSFAEFHKIKINSCELKKKLSFPTITDENKMFVIGIGEK